MNYKIATSAKYFIDRVIRRKRNLKFNGKILSMEGSNQIITDLINSKKPASIGKLGETELETVRNYLSIQRMSSKSVFRKYIDFLKYEEIHEWTAGQSLWQNSGFFPINENNLELFSRLYISLIENLDFFATAANLPGWYANKNEDYVINRFYTGKSLLDVGIFDPVSCPLENHWVNALEGKKVLVIHPFAESIKKNYENRLKIFPQRLLPDFELKIFKSIQSAGETKPLGYNTWFDALEYQKEQLNKINFDVALIGAGAYGLPLAVHSKKIGKQGIHIGGALQLYFGIIGKRWENSPMINRIRNEHWTRPLPDETPVNYKKVGDGQYAYW